MRGAGRHLERGWLFVAEGVARGAEPSRRADASILNEFVEAVIDKRTVRFRYQPQRSDCVISPHAIVNAVGRLRVRGWDQGRTHCFER